MGNILFISIITNCFIFSFIFWLLTFLCKYFYQDKYSSHKLEFYECGFKSISNIRLKVSVQFVLIAVFLVLYDGEFLVLFPVLFNTFSASSLNFFIFFIFIFFIFFTLLVDYLFSALEWTI